MEEKIRLPNLMFFQNGNSWKGSAGLLRYQVERPRGGEDKVLPACVWCGPFCRELSQVDEAREFPLSEEGLEDLRTWLTDWQERMNRQPTRTPEEIRAWRDKARAEQQS